MGEKIAKQSTTNIEQRDFVRYLIEDIKALELLLEKGGFEDDIVRIGAEQEICLINEKYRPAAVNLKLLEQIQDNHFTTELASYNIEINLDPFELKDDCFSLVESQLRALISKARKKASSFGADLLMAGILPTIGKGEVDLGYLTPIPRYHALNESLKAAKGDDFTLKIRGVDELYLKHDSVMFEACNTSFQLHLQIPSDDFIASYNWAQAISGPVLSVCCNSPLLMGRELWKETRIALFQQSLDTRRMAFNLKKQSPRVGFGNSWEKGSVAEIFKDNVSRHGILLTKKIEEGSLSEMERGEAPKLHALRLHNGTVYRWNRPCYGIGNGKPHLRIENRYIPAGPSIVDEMANFAFWVGLMKGRPSEYDDITTKMDFASAKTNFIKAARTGKETIFVWEGETITAKSLVTNILIPIARKGLMKCNIDKEDIDRYLTIIEHRTKLRTGEQWQVRNYRKLKRVYKTDKALTKLTEAIHQNQIEETPIHLWPDIKLKQNPKKELALVKEIMTTGILKVGSDDYANIALAMMEWNNIHHLPVEDEYGEMVGLCTWTDIHNKSEEFDFNTCKVSDIMVKNVYTINPENTILEAKEIMTNKKIGCLPVCIENHLTGIISKSDLV